MSNFLNKIPVSPITSFGNPSVPNGSTIGTNFSILQTGGYMEVYTLSGLTYTIPPTTGLIEFSGNSIPIQLTKGSGSVFSPDVLTLNSDNISSGRRKLGMLVYVYETNKIYQFRIDNYDTLWNNATGATGPGGATVVISDFGTTVKNNSPEGQSFIDAWTASTISGVGGYNDTNASWRVLSTGGSSSGGTSITGGTFDNNTDTLTLNNSTGGTVTITGFTDYYTTGFTFNPTTYDLTIQRNDGLPNLSVNLSILSSDVTITGGTYNSSNGTATFTNNTGGTFNVTGFLTGFTDIYVTGGTFNNNNQTLTLTRTDNVNIDITGFTDVFVTGGTYSNGTTTFTNNTGGTFNVSGLTTPFTGGTVTGATNFTGGLTANTFSASTYLGLPIDIRVTGATKSGSIATFRNNTGGTFTLTGLTDTFVTGATKSGSVATFTNNTGGTFTLTGLTDVFVTGGTHSLTGGTTTFRNNTGGTFSVVGYFRPSDDIYVTDGDVGHGPSTTTNRLVLNRNNAGDVIIENLVDISEVTKSEMDELISKGDVIQGKTYKIYGCDTSLYYNGEDDKWGSVYTTIYLMGLENDKLTETGVGIFYTPKYDTYQIFTNGQNYAKDDKVIWGGFVWNCDVEGTYNSVDIFTLDPSGFTILIPFKVSEDLSAEYNIRYDDIIYDYENDRIIYRNENDTNIVQTTVENIEYWTSTMSLYNPIKAFQWGKIYNGTTGIGNQRIINSYNENINYKGLYQTNFYFNNLSYQTNVFVDSENSYQTNFHFENKSYQSNSNIEKASYQDSLYFTTNSYQTTVNIDNGSHQKNITLNNDSYQDSLLLDEGNTFQNNLNFTNGSYQNIIRFDINSYQTGFTFNNGSYQYNVNFYNTKTVPSQEFFNFNNGSYQSNFDVYDSTQSYFEFNNSSYQSSISSNKNQTNFIFDDGSQYNSGNLIITQENVTIKGFSRDVNGLTVDENGVYFIHNLPTKTTSKLIGKVNNELIEVDNLYYDGSKWVLGGTIHVNTISATTYQNLPNTTFTGGTVTGATSFTNGLTANTISATTYQNLPVSGVTGGTGISANTSDGLVTIVNTLPDQIVTLSGGTGISTGGTYPNFVLTNTAPDQTVTITGGTNISVNGTYPNFGINFTGSTGASGDFLPLSGGTVTGGTIFTSGVTANTISEVNYVDFKTSPTVPNPTGGTLYYDSNENALSYKPVTNQNDVTVNLGQESLIRIFNDLPYQINNGQVLHITGSTTTGGTPTVALANASKLGATFTESLAQTSGVATHDIPSGEFGFMTNFGVVRDLNTSAFTAGQEVFLSDTVDGALTNDPNNLAFTSRVSTVGYCLESSPTTGKILVVITNENPLQSLTQQEINVLLGNTISTGTYFYTGATTASTTTINVSPMRGWIVYNTGINATNPLVLNVYYSGGTNLPVSGLTTSFDTYLLVNSGGTLYQTNSYPTPIERRQNIFLGRVVHPNKTTILNVEQSVDFEVSPYSSIRDLWVPIKLINEGVVPSPNGATLTFKTSSGTFWGNGINFPTNELNPNSITVPAYVPASFYYTTQTGGTFTTTTTTVDTTNYDVGGVITNVPGSGDYTTQRIYMSQSGVMRLQYGQTSYPTLAKAIAAISSETFVVNPDNALDCILIGLLTVKDGTSDLSNTDDAIFTFVSKFGDILGGTGGIATTTLQQAYNNSIPPEILTNSTLGALTIQNGTGNADSTSNLYEGANTAGTITSFIRADGLISGSSISTQGFTANTSGLTSTTISATTYSNLPVSGVTGGTGISANTTNGLVTIVNTSPDQTVTITGGTNIQISGTYPNFGINFTGSTGASGDFLSLSGGTVTGETIFTSGLTANTISATTYQGINRSFGVSFDGMGSVITVNSQATLTIPYNMVIQSWVLLSDITGSIVIDLWKDTYANYPPTSGDTITGSAIPSITNGVRNQSSTLTGWNTIVNSGDIITFNVNSCTGMTKSQLTIIGKEF